MGKKIAMIIAPQGFRDEEYWEPKAIFEKQGWDVRTVSTSKISAISKFGKLATIDLLLSELNANDFDVILFVGGPGCRIYFDDSKAHQLIYSFLEQEKPVTAICSATVILARAGVLKGKRATVFPGDASLLEEMGTLYTGKPVEQDGLFITASGPESAQAFAQSIVDFLQ